MFDDVIKDMKWRFKEDSNKEFKRSCKYFEINNNIKIFEYSISNKEPYIYNDIFKGDYYHLLFCFKGRNYLTVNDCDFNESINKLELSFFTTRNKKIYLLNPANETNIFYLISFSRHLLRKSFGEEQKIFEQRVISKRRLDKSKLEEFHTLFTSKCDMSFDYLKIKGKALSLISHSLECLFSCNLNNRYENTKISDPILKAKLIVKNDLSNPPNLKKLSELVGVSHPKLNKLFKSVYGKTFCQWCRCLQINASKQYLCRQENSITEIAFKCGFCSSSHFCQTFKKHEGQTPYKYRSIQKFFEVH